MTERLSNVTLYSAREIKRGMIIRQGVVMAAFNLPIPSPAEILNPSQSPNSKPKPNASANQNQNAPAWKVLIAHAGPYRHVSNSEMQDSRDKCPGCTRNTFAYASKLEVYS